MFYRYMKYSTLALLILTVSTSGIFARDIKINADDLPIDDKPINRNQGPNTNSFADVLDAPQKAVVSISTFVKMGNQRTDPRMEMWHRFFGIPLERNQPQKSHSGEEERELGLGSGVLISEDGFILTNNHVIKDERGNDVDKIEVTLSDDRKFQAILIGSDPQTDVAVLKIDQDNLPFIPMATSENLKVGDIVFAVGNPMGVGLTVTMGIVSAKGRSALGILGQNSYENFIQTDASINMGNSGGALVDSEGRLVGINTAILSRSGGNIGIGFAIPITMARNILLSLVNQGEVKRGYLGVQIRDITDELASIFGLSNSQGALVEHVQENTPAEKAGIKHGDVIVAVEDKMIKDTNGLRLTISQITPGTSIKIQIIRNGNEMTKKVTLGDMESLAGTVGSARSHEIVKGVEVAELTKAYKNEFEIEEDLSGVVVTSVSDDSPYSRGFRQGMVILEINRKAVSSVEDCKQFLKDGMNGLYVYERGVYKFLTIRK